MASRQIQVADKTFNISYEILRPENDTTSKSSKPLLVLFLHGWGAKKELMKSAFAGHFKTCEQIYIDMPGFGASKEGQKPMNTKDYADVVYAFLQDLNISPNIIIAHSFGGKVATLLCEKIKPSTLALLSTAGIPEPKKLSVKIKIAIFKLAKLLGFGGLRRYFASDDAKHMSKNMHKTS